MGGGGWGSFCNFISSCRGPFFWACLLPATLFLLVGGPFFGPAFSLQKILRCPCFTVMVLHTLGKSDRLTMKQHSVRYNAASFNHHMINTNLNTILIDPRYYGKPLGEKRHLNLATRPLNSATRQKCNYDPNGLPYEMTFMTPSPE